MSREKKILMFALAAAALALAAWLCLLAAGQEPEDLGYLVRCHRRWACLG